jgi:hypothetical protein
VRGEEEGVGRRERMNAFCISVRVQTISFISSLKLSPPFSLPSLHFSLSIYLSIYLSLPSLSHTLALSLSLSPSLSLSLSLSVGLVMVDCRNLKKMLAAKHKSIAAKLFEVLEKKTKEYADGVMDEFRYFLSFSFRTV